MADGNIDPKVIEQIDAEVKRFGGDFKAAADKTQRELAEMRAVIDGMPKAADVVTAERVDKFAASVETKQLALETSLGEVSANVDKALTALNRVGGGWKQESEAQDGAYQFALARMAHDGSLKPGFKVEPDVKAIANWNEHFAHYLRRDDNGGPQSDAFRAALQTGSDPDGGYLVPTEVSQRVIKKVFETSPIRQLATIETIGGKELEIVRDTDEVTAGWVGEQQARPETATAKLGLSKIPAHELYAAPRATQNLLEDAGINMEAWLAGKIGDKFSRVQNTAHVLGTGVGQPRGILTYPAGTLDGQVEQVGSGSSGAFTFDGLIGLVYSLKDPYAANADFLINRLGIRDISKLKDGQGRYLWEPSKQKGEPASLLGYGVLRAADVPVPGAGALSAVFGDIKTAYTIVDRLGVTTLRDPFTAKPYVIFYTRTRTGGDVVNFEALKIQVLT